MGAAQQGAQRMPALAEILAPKELAAMEAFGIEDLPSMLRLVPRRYVVPGPLRALRSTEVGEEISAVVTVESARARRMRSRPGQILEAMVGDGSESIALTFFLRHDRQVAWHRSRLVPGAQIFVSGTVGEDRYGNPQITHPAYEALDGSAEALARAMRPLPVYPLRKKITQATMRSAMQKALAHAESIPSVVPREVLRARGLAGLPMALRALHSPQERAETSRAQGSFVFEEAFVLQAIFAQRRLRDAHDAAPALSAVGPLQELLEQRLPFELTAGQRSVGAQLAERLARPHPTSALLQGDVGSGKTIIALRAMLRAVDSGHQAALLAPTEVLAEQHHRTITGLLGDLAGAGRLDGHPEATRVRLLTGSQRTSERRETLLDLASGQAGIVIGTHALLTESVEFAALGLVVIDEQHRFGVDHRRRLRTRGAEGTRPHVIVMTATPIPRTAALATVGDLDVLTLAESPGRRAGVASHVVPDGRADWVNRMWNRAAEEIAAGRQAFVVCPRIDESEAEADGPGGGRGVEQTFAQLQRLPALAGARIGLLHGRMGAEEKRETMDRMVAGEIDVLVATTVIEVGVDVPNASVMVIRDAERFGVSQLHQLRGRVGRGEHPGIAFLETRAEIGSEAISHLEQVAVASDGFALSALDLRRRGAGDLVGEEQSGLRRTLRFLDVIEDGEVIEATCADATAVVEADPELERLPGLREAIAERLADTDPDIERS